MSDRGREGTVTGACVEGALVGEAQRSSAAASPGSSPYGISDEEAVGVGLMCGGSVRVVVHELADGAREPLEAAAVGEGRPAALATVLEGEAAGAKVGVLEAEVVGASASPSSSTARSSAMRAAS